MRSVRRDVRRVAGSLSCILLIAAFVRRAFLYIDDSAQPELYHGRGGEGVRTFIRGVTLALFRPEHSDCIIIISRRFYFSCVLQQYLPTGICFAKAALLLLVMHEHPSIISVIHVLQLYSWRKQNSTSYKSYVRMWYVYIYIYRN